MSADSNDGRLRIEVVDARHQALWRLCLMLPKRSTVADALRAANLSVAAEASLGIHGRRCTLAETLVDGDRVEIYRPLHADARARRRARVDAQRRR